MPNITFPMTTMAGRRRLTATFLTRIGPSGGCRRLCKVCWNKIKAGEAQ